MAAERSLDLTRDEKQERDAQDDAKARAWSRLAKERADAGLVRDDSETLRRKLEEERRNLTGR